MTLREIGRWQPLRLGISGGSVWLRKESQQVAQFRIGQRQCQARRHQGRLQFFMGEDVLLAEGLFLARDFAVGLDFGRAEQDADESGAVGQA